MSLTRFLRKRLNDPSQLSLLLDASPSDDVKIETASAQPAPLVPLNSLTPLAAEPKIEHLPHLSEAHRAVTPKAGTRRIMLDQTALDYQLHRSKRHTIGFAVSEEGLRVTAPRWVPVSEIELAIIEKHNWIFN